MSRGFGHRQREILRALTPGETVALRDLLPTEWTEREYRFTLRAAHRLADAGRLHLRYVPDGGKPRRWHLVATRP